MRILKSIRLTDAAIFLALLAILAGLFVRIRHPDAVSHLLTDLSHRETFLVELALPGPWKAPPLSKLPREGDHELPDGGRDKAEFVRFVPVDDDDTRDEGRHSNSSDAEGSAANWPRAIFRVTARVDPDGGAWYNYGRVIPGASFRFQTSGYAMEGIILGVQPDIGNS